jgi:hypothetical protein
MGAHLNQRLNQPLCHRWGHDWLIGVDSGEFWHNLTENIQTLEKCSTQPSLLLIKEESSLKLLAKFFAALTLGHSVILTNPQWGEQEWTQVNHLNPTPWPEHPERDASFMPLGWIFYLGRLIIHNRQTSTTDLKPSIKPEAIPGAVKSSSANSHWRYLWPYQVCRSY